MAWIKNWFSNMLPMDEPYVYEQISYRTVEHFYQAMKFSEWSEREAVSVLSPFGAKNYAKGHTPPFWKEIKLGIMEFALRIKFAPGTSWHEKLMATGDEPIIEWNNWSDMYWGVDVQTSRGENHLGKLLMKIRSEYAEQQQQKPKTRSKRKPQPQRDRWQSKENLKWYDRAPDFYEDHDGYYS